MNPAPKAPALPALLSELLKKGAGYLSRRGVENPRLNAELILSHALNLSRMDLYLQFDKPLKLPEVERLRVLFQRRGRREPLQYITGRCAFLDFDVSVSPAVLIPRPETEGLAEAAFDALAGLPAGSRVLDLGTGSGILALALKRKFPALSVTGSDCSAEALAVAGINGRALGAGVGWVNSDTLEGVGAEPFDAIVSNPPYVEREAFSGLSPEVRDFEPRIALDGGAGGLEFMKRLLPQVPGRLKPLGKLLVEVGAGQSAAVARLGEAAGLSHAQTRPDLAGIPRVVIFTKKG